MLRTLVAGLVVEMVMLMILFGGNIPGPALLAWYRKLGSSAFAMDVLSLSVCVHVARLMVPSPYVPLAVLGIQVVHDLSFGYLVVRVPRGTMKVLDMFKDYARPGILAYDALLVLSVLVLDGMLERIPAHLHAVIGAVTTYVSLMFVHSF